MTIKTMAIQDTKTLARLWAETRDPEYKRELDISGRAVAELAAFKLARRHNFTFFLGDENNGAPYVWFNSTTETATVGDRTHRRISTWPMWARAHHLANTTGKVVYVYFQGDFRSKYAKVHPRN
jgi:hypothetical protein